MTNARACPSPAHRARSPAVTSWSAPRVKRFAHLVLALCAVAASAAEPSATAGAPAQRRDAQPLQRKPAVYPQREFTSGREGWVVLSFVVRTDGVVRDVVVED